MNTKKNFTEAEIMKALECCKTYNCGKHCPFYEYADCMDRLDNLLLDLINRKNAENEHFADIGKMYSEIKAEAIKEFAEKVQAEFEHECVRKRIWQIAKEMGVEL